MVTVNAYCGHNISRRSNYIHKKKKTKIIRNKVTQNPFIFEANVYLLFKSKLLSIFMYDKNLNNK